MGGCPSRTRGQRSEGILGHVPRTARPPRRAPAVILEAIRRGPWLPEQIEGVSSKYALEGNPPELVGVEPWVDAAIERRAKAKARAKATGDTATAEAFKQAAE